MRLFQNSERGNYKNSERVKFFTCGHSVNKQTPPCNGNHKDNLAMHTHGQRAPMLTVHHVPPTYYEEPYHVTH